VVIVSRVTTASRGRPWSSNPICSMTCMQA
jgi:hypothetical protein